ncbi:12209_t:CDS:2 [Funneliformis mosseae]|uniref:12209_t:CDS:1 n=1 Tax=Funneliformis mosseae TaxID=27381 RepID=A0A9N9AN88_FUNMO|nr:12209_t:CDS:2 [Funneliformis mosseae]
MRLSHLYGITKDPTTLNFMILLKEMKSSSLEVLLGKPYTKASDIYSSCGIHILLMISNYL